MDDWMKWPGHEDFMRKAHAELQALDEDRRRRYRPMHLRFLAVSSLFACASAILYPALYSLIPKATPADLVYVPLIYAASGLTIALLVSAMVIALLHQRIPIFRSSSLVQAHFAGTGVVCVAIAIYGLAQFAWNAPHTIAVLSRFPVAIGFFIVIAAGVALFVFRLKFRVLYGFSEAIIGVIVGASRYAQGFDGVDGKLTADTMDLTLGVLCAGVYLIVRGLDNVHTGLTKEPKDMLVTAVVKKFVALKEWLIEVPPDPAP